MFKSALTKAKYPLDGKIDFSTPKNAPKKVSARKKSSPLKRKVLNYSTEESEPENSEPKKTKKIMKDQGSQTSPAFVKAAKAAKRTMRSKKIPENPEIEEFVAMAKKSAKKAVSENDNGSKMVKTPAKKAKSPGKKARVSDKTAKTPPKNDSMSNPTPAMLALMAKKAENSTKKRKKN